MQAHHRLGRKARASGTDWALGIEARCRALVSDGDDAERPYRQSIGHLDRTTVRSELARTHLRYGEWLRRANRRADARKELTIAHDSFNSMGLTGFADGPHAAGGHRSDGPHAHGRCCRCTHTAGGPDRRLGSRRPLEL
jgi:hypothetical protein